MKFNLTNLTINYLNTPTQALILSVIQKTYLYQVFLYTFLLSYSKILNLQSFSLHLYSSIDYQ